MASNWVDPRDRRPICRRRGSVQHAGTGRSRECTSTRAQLHRGLLSLGSIAAVRPGPSGSAGRKRRGNDGPRRPRLATIQLEHNRADAALSTLGKPSSGIRKRPAVPALLFRAAEALQKQKRLAEAEARFLKVAEDFPDDAWADDALQRAAQAALERGDFAAARARGRDVLGAISPEFTQKRGPRHRVRAASALSGNPKETVAILEPLVGGAARTPRQPGPPKAGPAASGPATGGVHQPLRLVVVKQPGMIWSRLPGGGRSAQADAILLELQEKACPPRPVMPEFLASASPTRTPDDTRMRSLRSYQYLAANPRGDVAEFAMAHLVMARTRAGLWTLLKMLADLAAQFPEIEFAAGSPSSGRSGPVAHRAILKRREIWPRLFSTKAVEQQNEIWSSGGLMRVCQALRVERYRDWGGSAD